MKLIEAALLVSKKLYDTNNEIKVLSPTNNFEFVSLMSSVSFGLVELEKGVKDTELISEAIHNGWAAVAILDYGNMLELNTPTSNDEKARRFKLADTKYEFLIEDEKEKDRAIAKVLIDLWNESELSSVQIQTILTN